MVDNPIMIGGSGSSGTTLISYLLDHHTDIYSGPELNLLNKRCLYTDYVTARQQFGLMLDRTEPIRAVLDDVDTLPWSTSLDRKIWRHFINNYPDYGYSKNRLVLLAQESDTFRDFVDRFFESLLEQAGKIRWAEKTPLNCYCIGEFLSLYPAGQYVHVVRDGRDVTLSLIKRGYAPEVAFRRWCYDTCSVFPFREHPRVYLLKYEDLVSNPQKMLGDLLRFLNAAPQEAEILQRALSQGEPNRNTHESWNAQPNQPITTASIGKWKKGDWPEKTYVEQLFAYTEFAPRVAQKLGLERPYNGLDVMKTFDYIISDNWNPNPLLGLRFIKHHLTETVFASVRQAVYFTTRYSLLV